MSNALVAYETDQGQVQLSPDIIKKYLVNGNGAVTDQEVTMFLNLCKYQKLNPFLREAYLIKFGTSPATIITGKEVFTKRASRIKECEGWQAGITVMNSKGELERRNGTLVLKNEELVGGWCKVFRSTWKVPVEVEVSLAEFNKGQSSWKTMPATMIRKVAIVSALREAFPEDFQGLYDSAEMPVDNSQLPEKVIDLTPSEPAEEPEEKSDIISSAQAKRMFAMAESDVMLVKEICLKYGYTSSKEVKKSDYDTICKEIEASLKSIKDEMESGSADVEEAHAMEPLPWEK
jgi:phage recombination protein Bet